jgi:hypothetical protein
MERGTSAPLPPLGNLIFLFPFNVKKVTAADHTPYYAFGINQ